MHAAEFWSERAKMMQVWPISFDMGRRWMGQIRPFGHSHAANSPLKAETGVRFP